MSVNDDRYVGRAHARRTETRHGCRPAVSTTAAGGCKCAPFDDRRDTPRALHLANVMVRGPTDSTSPVAVFEGSILATVALSAPHVMVKTAGAVLDGFGDLPEVDRRMLYETFRVWLDNDALVVGHPVQSTTEHAARRFSPCQPWAVGGRLDLGTVRLQRVEPNAIAVGVLNDDQSTADRIEDWRMQDAQFPTRGRHPTPPLTSAKMTTPRRHPPHRPGIGLACGTGLPDNGHQSGGRPCAIGEDALSGSRRRLMDR